MPFKVMLVAGETSGDLHAAHLVRALRELNPQVRFIGMGSHYMREAGVEMLVDSASLAVVGIVEVLAHFPDIKAAMNTLREALSTRRPDLLILVDYPDFNLRLAASARQAGVKVLYYISPQIWAWRPGRVHKIRKLVDMMAVVFPFEVPIYEAAHVPVRYTGHPLVDEATSALTPEQAKQLFGLHPEEKVVGLFPGSRRSEIKRLMSVIVGTARLLRARFPKLQFILPLAPGLRRDDVEPWLQDLNIRIVEHSIYDVIQSCDAIVTASGTATLQIALLEKPMAIIYRVSPLSYWLGRWLISVRHVGLVNIVLERTAVREFLQHNAKPQHISDEIGRLLTDSRYREDMRRMFKETRARLGEGRGSLQVARLADQMLKGEI